MDFVAVDVETACEVPSSVCQVGMVGFASGEVAFEYGALVRPLEDFSARHTALHGLDARAVSAAPTYAKMHAVIERHLSGRVVVSHSPFDRRALNAAAALHRARPIDAVWHDSVLMARRAWPDLDNHRLATLASALGVTHRHHDALSDARTAGVVAIAAMRETGLSLEALSRPIAKHAASGSRSLRREGQGEGPLAGQSVAMTGGMSVPKAEMAERIAQAGGAVTSGPTKKTTMLVLGTQDPATFAGKAKSAKHLRAEALIAEGQSIRVLTEAEFLALLP